MIAYLNRCAMIVTFFNIRSIGIYLQITATQLLIDTFLPPRNLIASLFHAQCLGS